MFHRKVTHLKQIVVRIKPTCESQMTRIIENTKLEYSRVVTNKRQDEQRRNVKKEKQKIKRKEKDQSSN